MFPSFRWCSSRVCCTLVLATGFLFFFSLGVHYALATHLETGSYMILMFTGSSLGTSLLFLQLSTRWPSLSRTWAANEESMRRYGYPRHLGRKARILTISVFLAAAVEHALAIISRFVIASWSSHSHGGSQTLFEVFSREYFRMVFYVTQYAPWKGIAAYILHVFAVFAWNYTDLFIMLLSTALASRFQLLNKRLHLLHGTNLPRSTWRELRETYNSLASLTRTVDGCISSIVLFSLASNLCFTCHQILEGIIPNTKCFQLAYYLGSTGFLIGRTFFVVLCAASVHDQSLKPKAVLYAVPTESYCDEVGRFLAQVTTDEVSLTGCRFFFVTRSLILGIIGTVLTYEIVLVQFNFSELSNGGTSTRFAKTPNLGASSNSSTIWHF